MEEDPWGILAWQGWLPGVEGRVACLFSPLRTAVLCFLGGVNCFNPTSQKSSPSSETSASLSLIQRVRQKVQIRVRVTEAGSASEIICATKLAAFPFAIWATLVCVASFLPTHTESFSFFFHKGVLLVPSS